MRKHSLYLCVLVASQALFAGKALPQDVIPPTIDRLTPAPSSIVVRLDEIEVVFSEAALGVDAGDLLVNNQPATELDFGGVGVFRFQFTQPLTGVVQVAFAANHGITDEASPPNAFIPPAPWTVTLNPALALYGIRINEFLTDNENGKRDEDGTEQDWIELYNPATIPVQLGGCFLTDDKLALTKWRLPSFTLPPNTYLLIWASNKDRTNSAFPLHTNFRLDPDGEFLALVDPTGTNLISYFDPEYPPQSPDISYGRDLADPDIVGYFATPTPEAANNVPGSGIAPPVKFSRDGGTFITPFNLTMQLDPPNPNAVIRYVLATNGATASATVTNVPGTNSPIYSGPIPINITTQVRVRVFEPGKLPSEPVSVSFIQIAPDLAGFSSDVPIVIVHNFGQGPFGGVQADRSAIIASFHSDYDRSSATNKPDLITRGAANDRGSSTGNQPKVNMAVEFWDEFNQDANRPFLGMPAESDWVLYGINGFDPGMMHNAIFHWFGRGVGRYSSRTRYTEVFLKVTPGPVTLADYNGVYLLEEKPKRNNNRVNIESLEPENTNAPSVTGGYLLRIDRMDADERTFSVPSVTTTTPINNTYGGQSVIVDYPNSIQWGSDPRRVSQRVYLNNYFSNFIYALTGPNFTDPNLGYAAYINVDSWVNDNIMNVICFNVDGYRLSGYFFKDRNKKVEQGPPWDCDRCLGTGGQGNTPQGDNRCFNPRMFRIPTTSVSQDNGTDFFGRSDVGVDWWDRLFRDPDFWQRWIDHYQQFRTNQFSNEKVLAMIDGFYNELKESQVRDQRKWSGSFTYPRWGVQAAQGYTYDFGPPDPQFTAPAKGGYFTNEVNFQKKWLLDHLNFIDTNFLAMPLMTVGTSAVTNGTVINVQAAAKPGTLILYTLDGTDPRLPGGNISPLARTNVGSLSVTITSNTWLFARCYNPNHFNLTNVYTSPTVFEVGKPHSNSFWSGPISATFYTSVPPLRITEIMYHPANPPTGDTNDPGNFEYIEVRNTGGTPLNVNRFRISGGIDFNFPNALLAAGEYAVIVRHQAAFQSRYGATPRILGTFTNNLANDGDRLILEGGQREPIHDFSYDDEWYPITDGPGFSLQIVNDAAPLKTTIGTEQKVVDTWGLITSWRASGVVNGTPGAADSGAPTLATIYVNEALTHTDPSPGDAIELYNPTGAAVNVGGWFLTDSFNNPKKYRIPDGTTIGANGYVVFYESNSFGLGLNGFALSAKGDSVYVFSGDAATNLTGWYHGFDFGAQFNGATFGRYVISTGNDHFPSQISPTLGAANSGPKVGPVVVSEINYNPPDLVFPFQNKDNNLDEYIELHNISGSPVQLFDPAHPLNTWRLGDAVSFEFPVGTVIPAGGYVLVVGFDPADADALQRFVSVNNVPAGTTIFGPWLGQLDNSQDSVELLRPDVPDPIGTPTAGFVPYVLVDRVKYENVLPWPVGANGFGASISRTDDASYGNDPANWRAVVKTPGAPTPIGGTPPVVTVQPANTTGIETKSVMLSVTATGTTPLGYQWTFNGVPIPSGVNSVLVLNNLQLSQAGTYACYVLNPAGGTVSSNATLTILKVATIVQQPTTQYPRIRPDPLALDPTNATFTVQATSTTPLSYQWKYNGTNIAGATGTSLTVSNVTLDKVGTYTCDITDSIATISTTNSMLIPLVTPVLTQLPLSQTVPAGALVSASATIGQGNPPPFYYEWRRGSTPIGPFLSNSRTSVFNFFALTNVTSTQYRLVVTNLATTNLQAVAVTFNIITVADNDRDGIPDDYEASIGLNTNNAADALLDADGDKMTNLAEYQAGTDPADASSYLRVDQSSLPGVSVLTFGAVSNRTYTIQYSGDLGGAWSKLVDVPARTTNRTETIQDPRGGGLRIYRIRLPAQP